MIQGIAEQSSAIQKSRQLTVPEGGGGSSYSGGMRPAVGGPSVADRRRAAKKARGRKAAAAVRANLLEGGGSEASSGYGSGLGLIEEEPDASLMDMFATEDSKVPRNGLKMNFVLDICCSPEPRCLK